MAELPDDLIKAILPLLPVKSLIRFKCVDKSWCALIRNPYFMEKHRTHSALRPAATHLVLTLTNYNPEFEQTILTATANGGAPSPILPNILEHGPFNLSCCHGLISMHPHQPHKAKAKTFVYNPSTRESLSFPFNADAFEDYELVCNILGFEPVSNQYKLVIFGKVHRYCRDSKHCEIITLGGAKNNSDTLGGAKNNYYKNRRRRAKNNWRRVIVDPLVVEEFATCLNGALHWLTSDRQRLLVLYLESEEFGTIPTPDRALVAFQLCEVGGRLTLVESGKTYGQEKSFRLWTLKDYYNNVWVKQSFNFSMPPDLLPPTDHKGRSLTVVGGMNSGEILICVGTIRFGYELFGYDMKTKKGRKINVGGELDQPYINVVMYTESMRCY